MDGGTGDGTGDGTSPGLLKWTGANDKKTPLRWTARPQDDALHQRWFVTVRDHLVTRDYSAKILDGARPKAAAKKVNAWLKRQGNKEVSISTIWKKFQNHAQIPRRQAAKESKKLEEVIKKQAAASSDRLFEKLTKAFTR